MNAFNNDPEMLALLRGAADADGRLDYGRFTALALHHPERGYYRRMRQRVGKETGTDFYTAASLGGPLFGRLVRAAAENLLGEEKCRRCALVEVGAEPEQSLFAGEAAAFAGVRTLRAGEPLTVAGGAVVFANELLDAQPFHRLTFRDGGWRELGVRVGEGEIAEVLLEDFSAKETRALAGELPTPWHEGWVVDFPSGAEEILRRLVAQEWAGALVFFDYGKTLSECLMDSPEGTARAYWRHRQHNDLLARPGEQDLTCHVLWDRLERLLADFAFAEIRVERQEAFFMRRAAKEIAQMLEVPDAGLEEERSRLRALLHPAHFGHKFQVLTAVRRAPFKP